MCFIRTNCQSSKRDINNQRKAATFRAKARAALEMNVYSCSKTSLSRVMCFRVKERSLRKFAKLKGVRLPLHDAFLTGVTQIEV